MQDFEMQIKLSFYHDGMDYCCQIIDENDEDSTEPAFVYAKNVSLVKQKILDEIDSLIRESIKQRQISAEAESMF